METPELDALLRRARQRDPAALSALVERYSRRVFGLLFRLTADRDVAEDLLQETFLRVVRTIDRYEEAGRFEAWLFRIAANLARDRARQHRRRGPQASLDDGATDESAGVWEGPGTSLDPPQLLADAERGAELAAAVERLSPADREVLLLRHYGDLSFREIAELLGVPLGTALARAHRALQRLRSDLTGVDE